MHGIFFELKKNIWFELKIFVMINEVFLLVLVRNIKGFSCIKDSKKYKDFYNF